MLGALLGCGLALTACSNRERTNPLDPLNPETAGIPAGFRAVAASGEVQLYWTLLEVPDLAGYEVHRRGPADTGFVALTASPLSPTTSSYLDAPAGNDTLYTYRVRYRLTSGDTGGASEALARPGSANLWVMDSARDALARMSPDGRHKLYSLFGLNNPAAMALETTTGRLWGGSVFEGFLALWEPSGTLVEANGVLETPLDIAPIPSTTLAWASDGLLGRVFLLDADGTVQNQLTGFRMPYGVAYDAARLRLWVADRDDRRLVAYDLTATPILDLPLSMAPWRVALSPSTGDAWISSAEGGRIERRAVSGALVAARDGLARPFALAVDAARDEVWVVLADGGEAICLDAAGQIVRRIGNLGAPRGIAMDATRDEVWITVLGRLNGDGQLLHFTRDGVLLQATAGFGRPFAVLVDPDRNPAP